MNKFKWHIACILIYVSYILLLDFAFDFKYFRLVLEITLLMEEIWIFYSFYYILTVLFFGKKSIKIYSIPLFLISISVILGFTYLYDVVHRFYFNSELNLKDTIYSSLQLYSHFILYSVGYFFFERFKTKQNEVNLSNQKLLQSQKEKLESDNKNFKLEEEKNTLQTKLLESEINYLRAQINPHFLFNCLNFFYAEALETKPKLSEGIIMLSEIMRYSLKDFSKTGGMASLEDELMHIDNVINIHQMRFDNNLNISLEVIGNADSIQLAPMILITLVENIFKHGDLHDVASPAKIICTINEEKEKIIFATTNKIKQGTAAPSSGIGIENIEQRLNQLYKNDYSFYHANENNMFNVEIHFPYQRAGKIATPTFSNSSSLV